MDSFWLYAHATAVIAGAVGALLLAAKVMDNTRPGRGE
jgi:hypothetical protein